MSFGALTAWTLARAALVAACSVAAGLALRALLARTRGRPRFAVWVLLLAPFIIPAILVGYAWSNFSLSLIRHPGWNEAFYMVLLWMRLTPVAAIVLCLAPSPVSAQAVHCRRMVAFPGRRAHGAAGPASAASYALFLARGPLLTSALAYLLAFLLAFGEFEIASLMGVRSWTVWLFDAQKGGLAIAESLSRALLPLAVELAPLAVILVALLSAKPAVDRPPPARPRLPVALRVASWAYLAASAGLVCAVPCFIVFSGAVKGMGGLLRNFVIARDIGTSLLVAAVAGGCACCVAGWLVRGRRAAPPLQARGRAGKVWLLLLCVPGALGSLVLSLAVVYLFQAAGRAGGVWADGLAWLYDSAVPLVLTLTLVLLPAAFVLWFAAYVSRPGEALHAAQLLAPSASPRARAWRSRLVWQLWTRRAYWLVFLLFFWAYFELTASAILAPPSVTPVSVRLYNQMHYGRMAGLSAMVLTALAAPLLLLALAAGARALWHRLRSMPPRMETARG